MSLEQIKGRIPDHAKDLRINLGVITSSTALTPQQAWGTAIAAATSGLRAVVAAASAVPHACCGVSEVALAITPRLIR